MIPIKAFFTDAGTPKTGLTITINVWRDDGTHIINNGTMTEMGNGWYIFNNPSINRGDKYTLDGSAILTDTKDRYQYGVV